MPLAAIGLGLGTAIAGGATAGAQIVGARMQSRGAQRAADTQTQAANYAADRQAESARDAERFQREQAQAAWREAEVTRRANYDQWAAMQRRIGGFSAGLGYGAHEIPAYVGSPDPGFMGGGGPASGPMLPPGDPRGAARTPFTPPVGSVDEYLRSRPQRRVPIAPGFGSIALYL